MTCLWLLVLLLCLDFVSATQSESISDYSPIVAQLQSYIESNETFAMQVSEAFMEQNASNPASFEEMYAMFDAWLTIGPTDTNCDWVSVGNYVVPFSSTAMGERIVRYNVSVQWFRTYLNQWKQFLDSSRSTAVIASWMTCAKINMTEYVVPANGYQSFNEFFTRAIYPQFRPISGANDATVVVSPADGIIWAMERNIGLGADGGSRRWRVKGVDYNVSEMLNFNPQYVDKFIGGDLVQIVLNSFNYHRYHSPVAGVVADVEHVGGWYYAQNHGYEDRSQENSNRRGILYTSTTTTTADAGVIGVIQGVGDVGDAVVAAVHVGMGEVSSVNFVVDTAQPLTKGQEVGFFAYGGSSIVLLFEPGFIQEFTVKPMRNIQMGQEIAIQRRALLK